MGNGISCAIGWQHDSPENNPDELAWNDGKNNGVEHASTRDAPN